MVSSVNSSSSINGTTYHKQSLTDEQKATVNDILADYDPADMKDEDAESLKARLSDAGIKPSEDLKSILKEAGFTVLERSGPEGKKGKTKPPEFSKLMERLRNSNVSEEEVRSFIESLQNEKGKFNGTLMDKYG